MHPSVKNRTLSRRMSMEMDSFLAVASEPVAEERSLKRRIANDNTYGSVLATYPNKSF